ncbi:MAG TPA: 2-dehydro-3-deoxygalactonokinase, partial [Casimicrobiaceae bacterium]|nr:2-dehydro-3-deoxygalactonokinase [Casimicrobiaceae bacterium]
AFRFDASGGIIGEHSSALGVQKIEGGRFAEALKALLGGEIPSGTPLIACGMIGSRQGWLEAPYLQCPVEFSAIARALTRAAEPPLAIVPGLICRDADDVPDVMRGEETQILGGLEDSGERQLVVLPGTHCKWVLVEAGAVGTFATFMTGELYSVLREHSILGRLATAATDRAAFERGIHAGLRTGAALLHALFSARTLALTGELAPAGVADYLSGLLIGAEIGAARPWIERGGAGNLSITLIGDAMLCERYRLAMAIDGIEARIGPVDAAARGLWRLGQQAELVR